MAAEDNGRNKKIRYLNISEKKEDFVWFEVENLVLRNTVDLLCISSGEWGRSIRCLVVRGWHGMLFSLKYL